MLTRLLWIHSAPQCETSSAVVLSTKVQRRNPREGCVHVWLGLSSAVMACVTVLGLVAAGVHGYMRMPPSAPPVSPLININSNADITTSQQTSVVAVMCISNSQTQDAATSMAARPAIHAKSITERAKQTNTRHIPSNKRAVMCPHTSTAVLPSTDDM
jgi:hypothetical protein